jgi:metal-responsive CopG/Arc/MetJ family transcriptional regulator
MKRTTVTLTDQQANALGEEQRRRGVSTSALIREAIDGYLENGDQAKPLWFVALGESSYETTARDMEEIIAATWDPAMLRGGEPVRLRPGSPSDTRDEEGR